MNKKITVNGKKYNIIKLLGKGKGGYSYLADDGIKKYVLNNKSFFNKKTQHSIMGENKKEKTKQKKIFIFI